MVKNNGSGYIVEFVYRLLRFCLVVVVVGPTCDTAERRSDLEVTSVTPAFKLISCPVWVQKELSVYFLDRLELRLIRHEPDTKNTFSVETHIDFSFVVPVKSDKILKFVGGDIDALTLFAWDGRSANIMIENSLQVIGNSYEMFQCGKGDAKGRLWIGSSSSDTLGRLYKVDGDGTITVKLDNIGVPYAIAWNPDFTLMYLADETNHVIVAYPFDVDNGEIRVKDSKVIYDFPAKNTPCSPKGMTVDTDGHLWAACYGMNYIIQINTSNLNQSVEVVTQVDLPEAYIITSLVFGGADLVNLYVTAPRNLEHPEEFPESGKLFRVADMGSKGTEDCAIDVNWPVRIT